MYVIDFIKKLGLPTNTSSGVVQDANLKTYTLPQLNRYLKEIYGDLISSYDDIDIAKYTYLYTLTMAVETHMLTDGVVIEDILPNAKERAEIYVKRRRTGDLQWLNYKIEESDDTTTTSSYTRGSILSQARDLFNEDTSISKEEFIDILQNELGVSEKTALAYYYVCRR